MLVFFTVSTRVVAASIEDSDYIDEPATGYEKDRPWRKKGAQKSKKEKKTVSDSAKFKRMARELLGQPSWSERFLGLLESDVPNIALHPFAEEDLPIPLSEARFYSDGLVQALISEADGRYGIVERAELGTLVKDINEIGTRTDSVNPLGDLIDRARADLLLVGHMSLSGDSVRVGFKLVESASGRIVSTTQKSFKRKASDDQNVVGGLTLKGAAQKAATYLMRDLNNVRKISVQGLRYQNSGVHTPFGHYFMGVLGDYLRQKASAGPRNINDLEISDFIIEEEKFRGMHLTQGRVDFASLESKGQDFILKGTYWVFEQHVDVRLILESPSQKSISWRGRIVKSEIPENLKLIATAPPIEEDNQQTLGPAALYLTSNKGQNPSYQIGQKMVLALRSAKDVFVSCYYVQADGDIFKIFPNSYVSSARLNAGFLQYIPSSAMPFAFEFSPPRGVEAVKCFALDHDKSPYGKAKAFEPLGLKNERELTRAYRSLENVQVSEASLIVTLE